MRIFNPYSNPGKSLKVGPEPKPSKLAKHKEVCRTLAKGHTERCREKYGPDTFVVHVYRKGYGKAARHLEGLKRKAAEVVLKRQLLLGNKVTSTHIGTERFHKYQSWRHYTNFPLDRWLSEKK